MYFSVLGFCLTALVSSVTAPLSPVSVSFTNELNQHTLDARELKILASLENPEFLISALNHMTIPRAVGKPNHRAVKEYLISTLRTYGWTVEIDNFHQPTNHGTFLIENVIAMLNPHARHYLVLACHYDTMYSKAEKLRIVGATASAVPCSQLLNLAAVMHQQLAPLMRSETSLMFVFFDGEESIHPQDTNFPQYGYKHLATKWANTITRHGGMVDVSELSKVNLMIYLKFLGTSNIAMEFTASNTRKWHDMCGKIERSLLTLNLFDAYTDFRSHQLRYFKETPIRLHGDTTFGNPPVTLYEIMDYSSPYIKDAIHDREDVVDINTVKNLNKILQVFVASYFGIHV